MKNNNIKILLVDDEPDILEIIRFNLDKEGYQIRMASNGLDAIKIAEKFVPHLVILDIMMPHLDGIETCDRLRQDDRFNETIVMFLTARGEDYSHIAAFDAGADDYVTKPFSPKELVARIKALLRRTAPQKDMEVVKYGNITLNPMTHKVTDGDSNVELGPTEFKLLHFFMTHQERVYSRGQLLDWVWGANSFVEERTVDVYVRRLRTALEVHSYDAMIQTVRGVGYRCSAEAQ